MIIDQKPLTDEALRLKSQSKKEWFSKKDSLIARLEKEGNTASLEMIRTLVFGRSDKQN